MRPRRRLLRRPPWMQNKSVVAIKASSGPLSAAASRLSACSRALPSSRDFHFYNNFPAFKSPVGAAAAKADASLGVIGGASILPTRQQLFPMGRDLDDAHDWLVALNDDLLERFGAFTDEFKALRQKEETFWRRAAPQAGDGFQVDCERAAGGERVQVCVEGRRCMDGFGAQWLRGWWAGSESGNFVWDRTA
jgi:exosome complex exonuclease RRP6